MLFNFEIEKKKFGSNIVQTDVINMYLYGISTETSEFDAMKPSEKEV